MKNTHAVLSYALLMLGLFGHPMEAKAESLVFTEEPEETVVIDHGEFDSIRVEYEASVSAWDADAPAIEISGDAIVRQLRVVCGNVRLSTDAPLETLILGEVIKESDSDWSAIDALQHVEIGTDVHSLQILKPVSTDTAYPFLEESVQASSYYSSYSGSCILRSGCQVDEASIYEYYYDGFSGEETALKKAHGVFPESLQKTDTDTELFCQGIWDNGIFPCEEVSDWLERYESRYDFRWYAARSASGNIQWEKQAFEKDTFCGTILLDSPFDPDGIPCDAAITIDTGLASESASTAPANTAAEMLQLSGNRRTVTVYSGNVLLNGDIDKLVIADRYRTDYGRLLANISVNGSISSLTLLGDCAGVTLSVTGSVSSGSQTSMLCEDQSMNNVYFFKEADGVSSILYSGTFDPGIYFYSSPECTGAGFRMDGLLSDNRRAAGMDTASGDLLYRRNCYTNLGSMLHELSPAPDLPDTLHSITLTPAGFAFELMLERYDETEDVLFLFTPELSPSISNTSAPLTFRLQLPESLVEALSASTDSDRKLFLIRMKEDRLSDSPCYELIDCTLEGSVLSFTVDRFSIFSLAWVIPDEPVVPDEPVIPDVPSVPDEPIVPDEPVIPDVPAVPDEAIVPNEPVIPDVPAAPDDPVVPDIPVISDVPVIPESAPALVQCKSPVTGDNLLASCGLFSFPFTIFFLLLGFPGVCIPSGTFVLFPEESDSSLTLYQFHADFHGISLDEYWRFDLLPAYTNPDLLAWENHLIVFYQDDRKRLPHVYVEMDSDSDWIDLDCPARGKNARWEVKQDRIYVYTAKELYICDATDPLAGWSCVTRN